MTLTFWQVDAFAEKPFTGNPAGIVALTDWLPDAAMQAIADENNLAETAFFVSREQGTYDLRWFTPTMEVPLCGHATLALAWVIFSELDPSLSCVRFKTKSGVLEAENANGRVSMDLPAGAVQPFAAANGFAERLGAAFAIAPPDELYFAPRGAGGTPGLIAVWAETVVRQMVLSGGVESLLNEIGVGAVLATAKGQAPYDFVSRFFAPNMGVAEDPVTGSMHATLTPFWSERLGKKRLRAYQASARGGDILCTLDGDRVVLSGACVLYLRGEIAI